LHDLDIALPGPRHAVRAQFDAICTAAGVRPRLRAEVDDMAMLRLIARDSGWLTLLPAVVVQDELKSGALVTVSQIAELQERFYAITTPTGTAWSCWSSCSPARTKARARVRRQRRRPEPAPGTGTESAIKNLAWFAVRFLLIEVLPSCASPAKARSPFLKTSANAPACTH
jgi:DNA-binding transcriptional LysR family regulator